MISEMLAVTLLTCITSISSISADIPQDMWESVGTMKVTEYCQYCNEGNGTSPGTPLHEGICASNPETIPYGATVLLGDSDFTLTMADYCGNAVNVEPTVDVYREWSDGECHCDDSYYTEVYIRR